MGIQLKNNAVGYLATAISASDTGAVLQTGNGAGFPALGVSDYFFATLASTGGVKEIVKVTARSGDSLTILRAQDDSTANSFAAGSRVELRVTAASVIDLVAEHDAAAEIPITPYGWITASQVQAAFEEVVDDLGAEGGSAFVGYLPAGTGAVPTTVQTKIRESVSVLDFGADPMGLTDSASAIQAAFTYAGTNGYVFFPTGNYTVGTTITYSCSFGGQQGAGLAGPGSSTWYGTYITFTGTGNAFQESAQLYGIIIENLGIRINGPGVNGIDIRYGGNDCLYRKLTLEAVSGSAPNANIAIYLRGQNPNTSAPNFHQHANHFDTIAVIGAFTTGLKLGDNLSDGEANSNYVSHFVDYLDSTASTYCVSFNGYGSCFSHIQCYNPIRTYGACSNNAAIGCYFEMPGAAIQNDANVGERQSLVLIGCQGLGSAAKVVDTTDPGGARWSAVGEYTRMATIQTTELYEMVLNAGVSIARPNVSNIKFSPLHAVYVTNIGLYVESSDGILYFKDAAGVSHALY